MKRSWVAPVLGTCVFTLGAGCHKAAPARVDAIVAEAPVPAPEKRLADVVIATPDALWSKLQKGIGGATSLLPSTLGGVVCAVTGLDLAFAHEIDGNAPAFGEFAEGAHGALFAFAVKLVDPRRARDTLIDSESASFAAKDDGTITTLVQKGGHEGLRLGLTRTGYLLVARDEAALHALGPYTYRTLPTEPLPPHALLLRAPHEALAGVLHDEIARTWNDVKDTAKKEDADLRARHGGRDPDFGDPSAILASADAFIEHALLFEGDLESARVGIDSDDDTVHLDITLVPNKGSGPATQALERMRPGDPSPIASLPANTTLGVLFRDDAATRAEDGAGVEESLRRALGPRLHEGDAKKLHEAVLDWNAGRGDWLAAGLSVLGGVRLHALTPALNADKATHAVREIVDLATLPAFADPLQSLLGIRGVVLSDTTAPGVTHASIATFAREPSPAAPRPGSLALGPTLGLAWGLVDQELRVVAGEDARALLAPAGNPKTLGDDPRVATAVRSLGTAVSFALIAATGITGSNEPDPTLLVGWGHRADEAWARADVRHSLLRAIVRRQTGL